MVMQLPSYFSKKYLRLTALVLFVVACFLPVYYTEGHNFSGNSSGASIAWGWQCLLIGYVSFVRGPLFFIAWLANIPFFIALILSFFRKAQGWSIGLAGLAVVFSLFSLFTGNNEDIYFVPFPAGLICWIISMIAMLLACLSMFRETAADSTASSSEYSPYGSKDITNVSSISKS